MPRKRFKTLDDLYDFYSCHDNKKDFENLECIVNVPATFNTEDLKNDNDKFEGLVPFVSKAYHDGKNLNGSAINADVFVDKTGTIPYRPLLAHIVVDEDGHKDFGSHDFIDLYDDDGNWVGVKYLETPVGVISEYSFEYDEDQGVNRAIVHGFLYESYGDDAISILEERGEVDCSIELMTKAVHFDSNSKTLFLDDYYVTGLTLLGADIEPGMAGSSVALTNFSKDRESVIGYFENLTNEQIEQVINYGSVLFCVSQEVIQEKKGEKSMEKDELKGYTVTYSYEYGEVKNSFSVSLTDRSYSIMSLLQEKVANEKDMYVWNITVYDDYAIYQDTKTHKYYKQPYSTADGQYSLDGDAFEVECAWIPRRNFEAELKEKEDEIKDLKEKFEETKNSFESANKELQKYKDAEILAQKEAVLADSAYVPYLESEAFMKIKDQMNDLTVDDLKIQAELAFAKCARETKVEENSSNNKTNKKNFARPTNKKNKGRYGNIFDEK